MNDRTAMILYDGKEYDAKTLANELGIARSTIYQAYKRKFKVKGHPIVIVGEYVRTYIADNNDIVYTGSIDEIADLLGVTAHAVRKAEYMGYKCQGFNITTMDEKLRWNEIE